MIAIFVVAALATMFPSLTITVIIASVAIRAVLAVTSLIHEISLGRRAS